MQRMMDQALSMSPEERKAFLREDARGQIEAHRARASEKIAAADAKRARRRERNKRILERQEG
jgi:hypothetical protein